MPRSAELTAASVTGSPLVRTWANVYGDIKPWAAIALVALMARAITFGNPVLHVDESFYFTAASAMLDGARLYVDIWDRKPIGLFLIYLFPAMAGPEAGIYAYQALSLLSVIATALLIRQIARAAGWDKGALPAALAYILWLNLAEGQGGQSPVFYNLPMALAALCIMKADAKESGAQRFKIGLQAMFLTGLALQIKYTAVFEGLFFGLWLLHLEYRRRVPVAQILAKALPLAFAALIPTIVAGSYFLATGHWQDFYFANFESILARKSSLIPELAGNAAILVLILSPLLTLAFWRKAEPLQPVQKFLHCWLIAALAALLLFGTWFDHYGLPVMLPAACCAAAFFARRPRGPAVALPILAFVALAGQLLLVQKRLERGTAEQVQRIADAIGHGNGCLFVYSGPTIFYPLTGRCSPGKYIFPSHLHRLREEGATGIFQMDEAGRILRKAPGVIMLLDAYQGENRQVRRRVAMQLARGYDLKASLPLGEQEVRIFSATAGAEWRSAIKREQGYEDANAPAPSTPSRPQHKRQIFGYGPSR